ncbi:SAGA-associated factor 11 [Fasciola gigantica]|uniref:SAGA-associated factor 11 n=1 Tax=Fasciola gigantica TaxID=46835 RepID=A0A504YRA8_FASGI|nr:SAGA-associated factor 11 [Fasciola gigantica]
MQRKVWETEMNTKFPTDNPQLTEVLNEVVDDLIDSCILDGIFAMHRAIKLDYLHVIAPEQANDGEFPDNGSLRLGVSSGRENAKAASCCRCVKCHSKVAATRFAPHLSNCMGLGRNSSRRANKRIAEQQRLEDFDDEADEDSTVDSPAAPATASDLPHSNRCTNGATNKHHSPLKLTISLVSVPGKSETSTKHVVRAVNVNQAVDSTRILTDPRSSLPRSNSKNHVTAHKNAVSALHKTLDPDIVLKEARVTLTSQDIHFPRNITG